MGDLQSGIWKSTNALAQHALQFMRLYEKNSEEQWRGEAGNSTWSSTCEQIHSKNESIQNFNCDIRGVQICFTFTKDESERIRWETMLQFESSIHINFNEFCNFNCRIGDEPTNDFCFCELFFKAKLFYLRGRYIRVYNTDSYHPSCTSIKYSNRFMQFSLQNAFIRSLHLALRKVMCSASIEVTKGVPSAKNGKFTWIDNKYSLLWNRSFALITHPVVLFTFFNITIACVLTYQCNVKCA